MLTDVEGLYRNWPDRVSLIPEISASELRAMLPELTSGMIPKAEALLGAVDAGVRTAAMIDGRIEHARSEEHTSELQSRGHLVCRLLLEKKNNAANEPTP